MRITSFWAKGYRSLLDVKLEGLGPFNVLYGYNGAGKSNILSAMQALFTLLRKRAAPNRTPVAYAQPYSFEQYGPSPDNRSKPGRDSTLVLGMEIAFSADSVPKAPLSEGPLVVEITGDWIAGTWQFTRLEAQHHDLMTMAGLTRQAKTRLAQAIEQSRVGDPPRPQPTSIFKPRATVRRKEIVRPWLGAPIEDSAYGQWVNNILHWVGSDGYALVGADRSLSKERLTSDSISLVQLLQQGRLKEALARASRHKNRTIRQRYREFQELMQGPPLERPPFDITQDDDGRLELVEVTGDSAYDGVEIPLDLAGLGIAQIYSILARCMLFGAWSVAIEEPEAHLHAPTSGMDLRHLLTRLVNEQYIDQLFIATHSNLFDLDATGYWDVSKDDENGTVVRRETDLNKIDKQHLYEPGPAKHALLDVLRYLEPDEVAYRRADSGETVTVKQMIEFLQADDPLAKQFLDDIHGAAVRAVRVHSKRKT